MSRQTFETAIRTCKGIISLMHYLFERYPYLEFILLGNIESDYLEGRFGLWRQLCGGNYYNSVTQFLQAEKTIRLRSLVSMGYKMHEIRTIFKECNINKSLEQHEEIKTFISDLESFKFSNDSVLNDVEKVVTYYIARYIAKSLAKENCNECNDLHSPGKVEMNITFETRCSDMDDTTTQAKEEFVTAISRGGLRKPSDYIYVASVHASTLCTYILSHDNLKSSLFDVENPRDTFVESYTHIIETDVNSSQLLLVECKNKNMLKTSVV